ncbi:hypothetical protein BDV28DRAFT_155997 [Aspergillus coremiiformis]|uniref:Uncharacterized protein n=1 Tax=Aspergillus coremiiformis TaxID=138285 RepID=A0A5N6ZAQ9_9EURO|nr:hypothetical protein BDV28DRAFT_155997 [Aspergillus coremiiformis]
MAVLDGSVDRGFLSDRRLLKIHPPNSSNVLRPGDFIDTTRQVVEGGSEGPLSEPDGPGTLHDIRNEKFYLGGTLTLTTHDGPNSSHPEPVIYDPYPVYNSPEWRTQWTGQFRPCVGPRGKELDRTNREDMMSVYRGTQRDFPLPMFGSYEALGLDGNVCADRYSRLAAYGYGADADKAIPGFKEPVNVSWDQVDWGTLQARCLERNMDRYKPNQLKRQLTQHPLPLLTSESAQSNELTRNGTSEGTYKPRSAVLLRSWHSMPWTENHRQYLRSLIMELALHSGAEYEVFLLVHVQDDSLPIFSDVDTVQHLKEMYIPPEFHNITVFFNDKFLEAWYPKVPEHRPVYQHLQPVQIFSQLYPDFDYYWQLEMDARNTGHMYHVLDRAVEFAKQQPRKYLWERNAYFYTPGAHGLWQRFREMVDQSMTDKESIWGPVLVDQTQPVGPHPPVDSAERENYEWGVGEEADLITFLPIFDPHETTWTFPGIMWNLPTSIPRRASPITMWRMSKRLLHLMHRDQAVEGIGLGSEMSAPTWAFWHGLKAVYVPHPIYVDGQWSPKELARIYNPGVPESINGGSDSIWNWDHRHDHIMYRTSYMFTTQTAEDLYRRWLGYQAEPWQDADIETYTDGMGRFWFDGGSLEEESYGRLCYPPMFLHTIKNSDPVKGPEFAVPVFH